MEVLVNVYEECLEFWSFIVPVTIYICLSTFYIVSLKALNEVILELYSPNDFALLNYNDGEPWKYFWMGVFLTALSIGLVLLFVVIAFKNRDDKTIMACILSVIVVVVFAYLNIKFITIPILKLILQLLFGGGAVAAGILFGNRET